MAGGAEPRRAVFICATKSDDWIEEAGTRGEGECVHADQLGGGVDGGHGFVRDNCAAGRAAVLHRSVGHVETACTESSYRYG